MRGQTPWLWENVLCFSYGKPGNWESKISKQVADQLGFQWEFVPYSRKKWYEWFNCEQRKEYFSFASNLSSLAHIQDWPAIWELKTSGKIQDHAIFVPGHSGDFNAGSHLSENFIRYPSFGTNKLIKEIYKKHYNLWSWEKKREQCHCFENKIIDILRDLNFLTPTEASDAFECWDWQERQAKFIVNSIKVYEYWGYDWRIPLWDNEFMDFWERVPLSLRMGIMLYDGFLKSTLFKEFQLHGQKCNCGMLKKILISILPKPVLTKLKTKRMLASYFNHPLQWYSMDRQTFIDKTYEGATCINSFLVDEYLNMESTFRVATGANPSK